MAELVENRAVVPTVEEVAHPRVSWGAVFAGSVTAVGIWMLLYALGLAIGASTLNVQSAGSAKSTGIFAGVWGVVAPLVALFIGGVVAGRGAGVVRRPDGAVHGLVTWGVAAIAGAWLLTGVMAVVAGGAASVGKNAAQAAAGAVDNSAAIGQAMHSAGLNTDDIIRPLNQRLQSEGRPPVSPDQIQAAARDALASAVREGRLDRPMLVQALAANTALSQQDAEQLADQVGGQLEAARVRVTSELQSATNVAAEAFWGTFVALALGLIAAVIGGIIGVPSRWGRRPRREVTPAPTRVERVPLAPPREVHP